MANREFETGANRNGADGKLHPYGFRNPLCEHSFYKYMDIHRVLEDGSLREPDNWWKGWDRKVSLDSMVRHVKDLENIHAGYFVYKEKIEGGELTYVFYNEPTNIPAHWHRVTEEEACNAIDFNSNAYKLEVLKSQFHVLSPDS